jgi:hypothetical protein
MMDGLLARPFLVYVKNDFGGRALSPDRYSLLISEAT